MGKRFFLVLLPLLFLAACGAEAKYPRRTPPEGLLQDPARIAAGRSLFLQKCAWCHGTVAEGRSPRANTHVPPPSPLASARHRDADPAYLYWRIETGNQTEPYRSRGSVMPAWGHYFTPEQIWSLVAYIKNRAKAGDG